MADAGLLAQRLGARGMMAVHFVAKLMLLTGRKTSPFLGRSASVTRLGKWGAALTGNRCLLEYWDRE